MKIAIVDDDKAMRDVLRAIAVDDGHEVVGEFGGGDGLIEFVGERHPDVVCLDFSLPGEDGLELLAKMDLVANQVDVIMITASDDPELKGHAADLGAAGFIRKPFGQAQIVAELKDIEQTRLIAAKAAQASGTAVAATDSAPAAAPAAPADASPPAATAAAPEAGVVPRTAVIVDDSGSIRLLLKGILQDIGIRVSEVATSGAGGIEAVRRARPALVCLDVDMPGMSGLEALPQIRAASPGSKVVMVTGNAGRAIVEASLAGGASGYFLKPIRPARVEEFVRKLLRLHAA